MKFLCLVTFVRVLSFSFAFFSILGVAFLRECWEYSIKHTNNVFNDMKNKVRHCDNGLKIQVHAPGKDVSTYWNRYNSWVKISFSMVCDLMWSSMQRNLHI